MITYKRIEKQIYAYEASKGTIKYRVRKMVDGEKMSRVTKSIKKARKIRTLMNEKA